MCRCGAASGLIWTRARFIEARSFGGAARAEAQFGRVLLLERPGSVGTLRPGLADGAMRIFVQRVRHASVTVDGEVVGEIDKGVVCLVGISKRDNEERCCADAIRLILDHRFWDEGSAREVGAGVLLVSQFTLYGRVKGRKPDFSTAMSGGAAKVVFDAIVAAVQLAHPSGRVATGTFGAMMDVEVTSDCAGGWYFDTCEGAKGGG